MLNLRRINIFPDRFYLILKLHTILQGVNPYEAYQHHPELLERLRELDTQIIGGTTAIVALIYNQKLYVANVGKFS